MNEPLIPCKECGRSFREEALAKHAKICKKVFKQKRKKFDTKKKRIIDSEHAMIVRHAEKAENNPKLKQIRERKKMNWKIQSEQLRQVARANREMSSMGSNNYGNNSGNHYMNMGGGKYNAPKATSSRGGMSSGAGFGGVGKKTSIGSYGGNNYDGGMGGGGFGRGVGSTGMGNF